VKSGEAGVEPDGTGSPASCIDPSLVDCSGRRATLTRLLRSCQLRELRMEGRSLAVNITVVILRVSCVWFLFFSCVTYWTVCCIILIWHQMRLATLKRCVVTSESGLCKRILNIPCFHWIIIVSNYYYHYDKLKFSTVDSEAIYELLK
jgi:hypothetical protein